jgi:hypothetical protein
MSDRVEWAGCWQCGRSVRVRRDGDLYAHNNDLGWVCQPAATGHWRRINQQGRDTLADYGVTQAQWLRLYPDCDNCGCPDDRCIGFHHDRDGDCDLRYWIENDIAEGTLTPARSAGAGRAW